MYKLKESKFDVLYEDIYFRSQSGGLITGDVVRFRKNALNDPRIKDMMEDYKKFIQEMMNSDRILKVSAVKQARPATQYGVGNSIFGYSVDVVEEYAPGLFKNPLTVPIEILERVDTGNDRQPVPDSLKRKDEVNIKPETFGNYVDANTLPTRSGTNL